MFDYSNLRKESTRRCWFCEGEGGVELYVLGGDEGPDQASLEQARAVVGGWDGIQRRAIALADSFMKDAGAWHVTGVDLFEARCAGFDYALTLWFDSANDEDAYGNTRFSVFFRAHNDQPGPGQDHPTKLVIEFV